MGSSRIRSVTRSRKGRKSLKNYLWLCLLACLPSSVLAQGVDLAPPGPEERDLTASRRVFPEIGPGLRGIREGADGRVYLLVSPQPGVLVFDARGKEVLQVGAGLSPNASVKARPAAIGFGEDFDVDGDGKIYVADRRANTILIFSPEGTLLRTIPVNNPVSVAALPEGEVAVATLRDEHLILVFDKNGRDIREFGDSEPLSDREDLNRYLSTGLLAADAQGHLFYAFPYMPEPIIRQYDRFGFVGQEIQYTPIDALQVAQAARKEIQRQERRHEPPYLKRNITAIAVDRSSGEAWVGLHHALLHFDKEGNRRATYTLYTPDGSPLEATSILVDKQHLLVGNEAQGIYEFPRPDKAADKAAAASATEHTSGEEKKVSP